MFGSANTLGKVMHSTILPPRRNKLLRSPGSVNVWQTVLEKENSEFSMRMNTQLSIENDIGGITLRFWV